ncbi:MAG: histidinol-phosphatase [Pirellulales bacterium]|nr:histidinol-phosphatase [Pirellulales bacterium]
MTKPPSTSASATPAATTSSEPSAADLAQRLDLVLSAGQEAAAITLRYFRQDNYQVELKADASPVTVADREAEQHLRRRIAASFPDDAVLGEEFDSVDGTSGFRWILDPIDGTKSFVHGVPFYGTMIGVEHAGRSVIGVVLLPGLDEHVYAVRGQGAWAVRGQESPKRAHVSDCRQMSQALFLTTAVKDFDKFGRGEAYEALDAATRISRTWGDCYGYLLVATGRAEVMVDPAMNVWDAAALQPILEEAGGTFTNWLGEPTIHGREGVATNGHLLDDVIAITRRAPRLP